MNLKIFFVTLALSLPFWWGINVFQGNLENYFYAQISQPFEEIVFVKIPPKPPKPELELQVKAAISVKLNESGAENILFNENINQPLPIASLTKLMTAVIILEDKNYDLEETWTISKTAANQENVPNYGNLKEGEKFTLKQLFDLMLIYSSNDATFAFSEIIGVENFVAKMSQKAEELGLKNTHFINPTGLDPENLHYSQDASIFFNYSTVKDLVKLSQYILKNHPLIFEISLQSGPYPFENGVSNLSLSENQTILGGKTGYTDEAGGCIIFLFKNGRENIFFNIILGTESQTARIEEMQKLLDWLNP